MTHPTQNIIAAHGPAPLSHGDVVICLANSIDKPFGKGVTGRISGFARLSSYHPREVMVDGVGWLWERDVIRVPSPSQGD